MNWLNELARLAAVAQLAIHKEAGRELNPDRPRDATVTVARALYPPEMRDAPAHRPPRQAPTPRNAA